MPGPSEPLAGREVILLVEDDQAVRDLMIRVLRLQGYSLLIAESGEQALRLADAHDGPIDLVISDIVMPRMTGLQLFTRLRSWYPSIQFLFISGYSNPPIDRADLRDGHTRFLPKPFSMARLASEGRALLDIGGGEDRQSC